MLIARFMPETVYRFPRRVQPCATAVSRLPPSFDGCGSPLYTRFVKESRLSWYRALGSRKTLVSIAVLVGAVLWNVAASELIQRLYPGRPIVPDLLFTLLPDVPVLTLATDFIMNSAIVLLFWYMFGRDRLHLPYYFFTAGVLYAFRGLLMILTPLGRPTGNLDSFGAGVVANLKQHGMFPSGHTMLSAAIFLLIDGKRHPGFKRATGLLCLAEMITLILSRGHYSIDIVGGGCR
jgi:membrane-associated phospholipid phosphatase